MSDRERSPTAEEERIEVLVAACLERAPDEPASVVDQVCSDEPGLTEEVRQSLEALEALGLGFDRRARDGLPLRLGGFRLLRPLGAGAMGVVYLAEQEAAGRHVALKILRPELLYFPRAQQRFRREMRIISSLEHPGIVRVHSHGETDGLPWIAMERVPGATLERVLSELSEVPVDRRVGADPLRATRTICGEDPEAPGEDHPYLRTSWTRAALHLVRELALALAHAHARGVLHRDVKPSNVLVTPEGRVLLFDFGLATDDRGGQTLTRSGTALGSEAYMAPEVLGGEAPADERSDVYSLGVMLFELLTGARPFVGEGRAGFRKRVLEGRTPSARSAESGVSDDADLVCRTALAREPSDRYPTAQALADDLGRVLEHHPTRARRPGPARKLLRWARRRPRLAAGSCVIALGLVIVGALLHDNLRMESRVGRMAGEVDQATARLDAVLDAIEGTMIRLEPFTFGQLDPPTSAMWEAMLVELEQSGLAPEAVARLHQTFGRFMRELGRFDRAAALSGAALTGWTSIAPDDLDVGGAAAVDLARALQGLGRRADARRLVNEWLARTAPPERVDPTVRANLLLLRADLDGSQGREKAMQLLDEAQVLLTGLGDAGGLLELHALRARTCEWRLELARAAHELGLARELLATLEPRPAWIHGVALSGAAIDEANGRWHEGLARLDEALAELEHSVGFEHPLLVELLMSRGRMLRWTGRPLEAIDAFDRAEAISVSTAVDGGQRAALALLLALCSGEAGLTEQGVAHARRAIQLSEEVGLTRLERDARHAEARVLHYAGAVAEAEACYRAALDADEPGETRGRAAHEWIVMNLSLLLREVGREGEAGELLSGAESRLRALRDSLDSTEPGPKIHVRVEHVEYLLGRMALLRGRPQEAADLFAGVARSAGVRLGEDHWLTAHARGKLGEALSASGRLVEAEPLLREAWAASVAGSGPSGWRAREMAHALADLCEATGRESEAGALRERAGPLRVLVYAPWN